MGAISLDSFKTIPLLLAELGLEKPGAHCRCLNCGSTDALSVQLGESGAYCRCHSCGLKGDLFAVRSALSNISIGESIKSFTLGAHMPRRTPPPVKKPAPPARTVTNDALVYELFYPAFENLITGRAADRLTARGIHDLEPFLAYPCLGWIDSLLVPGWKFPIKNCWLLLITNLIDGRYEYAGLKAHFEKPFSGSKCMWLPVGTQPPECPKHATMTVWPPLERFDATEPLFIFEGELKAARAISEGLCAISPTGGAKHHWTVDQLTRFNSRDVMIVFDNDEAGIQFKDKTFEALRGYAASIRVDTFREGDI